MAADVMTLDVISAAPDTTLFELARLMVEYHVGGALPHSTAHVRATRSPESFLACSD